MHVRCSSRCLVLFFAALCASAGAEQEKIRVALFADPKATDKKSVDACWKVLHSEPSFEVARVTSNTLLASGVDFDVMIFPGGTGNGEAKALGIDGGRKVRKFVEQGKGFIGICAGGYLMAEGWNEHTRAIELANTKLWDLDNWARGEKFIAVKTTDDESSKTMWFENGPIFAAAEIEGLPPYVSLVKYETDLAAKDAPKGMMKDRDAVIAASCGKGRVVGFGPHPELSPDLNHWLINAVRWAAKGDDRTTPTVATVLEGKGQ